MRPARRVVKWLLVVVAIPFLALALIVVGYAFAARSTLPELKPWHRIVLKEEFRAGRSDVATFDDYRRLEDRLFAELRTRILDDPQAADSFALGRYRAKTVPERLALDTTYNRSYELAPAEPRGAVLLVHGLSDSPYSMRAAAETFFARGFHVVVLRMPGHGTIPSMLRDVSWQDWYAAVAIAAARAASKAGPGKPFFAGGHSTGAALVTLYSLRTLEDASLPRPARLFLMSPAIGISSLAFLTNVISKLSFLPYFEKSEWIDVLPEYDPYKYNSFPVNAANQIYLVTRELQRALAAAGDAGRLAGMPRITVFHSLVDSTVKTVDVVRNLLALLPANGNELVLFDTNREKRFEGLIAAEPLEYLQRLRDARDLPFGWTLVGNRGVESLEMAAYTMAAGRADITKTDLSLRWPGGVFSLGHVAIPFPVDDPVYGLSPAAPVGDLPRFELGAIVARGESGALMAPLGMFARLRSNPFFDVIRERLASACD